MSTIENYSLTTEELATLLGITPKLFHNWQTRHGFLKRCTNGRGLPARYMFRDALAAMVATKLMAIGIGNDEACKTADRYAFVADFVMGQEVKIPFVGSQGNTQGVCLTFFIEEEGWRAAEFIAGIIEGKMGKAVADLARAEFKAAVEKAREGKGASD